MVKVVVGINTLISLILLYATWRVWRLRLKLTRLTNWLILAERCSHTLFSPAPQAFDISRQSIHNLRQTNQALELQIQQLQQIYSILSVGQRFWRWYFPRKVK
ncbi:hypothetical protein CEN41_13555 [Fischerella thermalis CCMEE 5330]|uniref:Uncharacterized protein n=1 Tax=Fischerella thermalis CCMEE 5330 TaxID=2019670 RepID=A0A2N6M8X0_9CYAN|nr:MULTISPECIES: hypothetical protein [Fischerella]PMB43166.1 hypothetical protein CEN41_13555 [Fischerella thermalis CCMEE 5330]BAU08269.1 hypothetical protein FIS3754_42110 [Fischerella sp. NIES-3754]BCX10632.1 MAG: hypothetical protein KatS3mg066_4491 [Fischerella sp.]